MHSLHAIDEGLGRELSPRSSVSNDQNLGDLDTGGAVDDTDDLLFLFQQARIDQAAPFGKTISSPFHASVHESQRRQNLRRLLEDADYIGGGVSPTMSRDPLSPKQKLMSSAEEDLAFGKTFSRTSNCSHDSHCSDAIAFGKRASIQSILTDYGEDFPNFAPATEETMSSAFCSTERDPGSELADRLAAQVLDKTEGSHFESLSALAGGCGSALAVDDQSFFRPPPMSSPNMLPAKVESIRDQSAPMHLLSSHPQVEPTSPTSPSWAGSVGNSTPGNRRNDEVQRRERERQMLEERERELLMQKQWEREQAFLQQLQREREDLYKKQREREHHEMQEQQRQEREDFFRQQQQQLQHQQQAQLQWQQQQQHMLHAPNPLSNSMGCRRASMPATMGPEGCDWSNSPGALHSMPPARRQSFDPAFLNYGLPPDAQGMHVPQKVPPQQCYQQPEQYRPMQQSQHSQQQQQQLQLQHRFLERSQQEQRKQRQPQQRSGHSSCGAAEKSGARPELAQQRQAARSTVMLRNLPVGFTRDMLIELLNRHGFARYYDFIYMPINFRTQTTFGYAFVNFVAESHAQRTSEVFEGYRDWCLPSDRICEVTWSDMHQGLSAHIERYRNSPVMHESVPDEYKPLMYVDGVRVKFPPPTKKIRGPRLHRASEGDAVDEDLLDELRREHSQSSPPNNSFGPGR